MRYDDPRPCKGTNGNVCVAEGCYGEACVTLAVNALLRAAGRTSGEGGGR